MSPEGKRAILTEAEMAARLQDHLHLRDETDLDNIQEFKKNMQTFTLQVHFVLYSSRSFIGVLIDLERLLRMGVDIIASSREKAPPQSGLGGSSSTAGPLPGGGVTLTSPADRPPLRGWRRRAPSCEEVAALAAGAGRGGGGVGRADGRGGREGGAAAVGGGGLETWDDERGGQVVQDEPPDDQTGERGGPRHLGSTTSRPLPVEASAVEAGQHLQESISFKIDVENCS